MRDFWRRIGGPHSINWLSFVLGYPTLLVLNILGSGVAPQHSLWSLVAAGTLGAAALFAVLILAKYTILRQARKKPIPLTTIAVIFVALLARAYVFDLMLTEYGLQSEGRLAFRFFATVPTLGITLVLMAYIMSLAKEFSTTYRRLVDTNNSLLATARNIDAQIRAKREEVVGSVRRELEVRLRALSGASAKQALRRWRDIIEDIVRPVSHELARQVTDLTPVRSERVNDTVVWAKVFVDSTAVQPFRPFAFSFWAGFATLSFAPLVWGWAVGVDMALVASLVPYAILSAFFYVWPRAFARLSNPLRALAFTLMLMVTAIMTSLALEQLNGLERIAERSQVPMVILWSFLGWGIALIPSLQRETARVLESLEESSVQLREETVRLNTAYRLQQQAIARALHGPIQDALSLAAFQLTAAVNNKKATSSLIEELNAKISNTLSLLEQGEDEAPTVTQALEDLAEFWEGVTKIRWKVAPKAAAVLNHHNATTATTIELVREACSNAVRHGRASQIDVSVTLEADEQHIAIRVSNNGALVKLRTKTGLGTRLLNELALTWTLNAQGDRTVLEARTPII